MRHEIIDVFEITYTFKWSEDVVMTVKKSESLPKKNKISCCEAKLAINQRL